MTWKQAINRILWTAAQAAAGIIAGITFHSPEVGGLVTIIAAIIKNLAAAKLAEHAN